MGYVSPTDSLTQIPEETLLVNNMKHSVGIKVSDQGRKKPQDNGNIFQ